MESQQGTIIALSTSASHTMSKFNKKELTLIEGIGIEGDAHAGITVKHRSRVAKDPNQPNLRQVHLIHNELLVDLATKGYNLAPGEMGENITTTGIDLLALPQNTILRIGTAEIEITGLRNPCNQLNGLRNGLMQELVSKDVSGKIIRKGGIMAIVKKGGNIQVGDQIEIIFPNRPYLDLEPV